MGGVGGGGVGGDADEDGGDGVPLNVVGGAGGGLECRREQLLRYFGERARAGGARGLPHRCCDVCFDAESARQVCLRPEATSV